jgi:hypothetical protein
MKVRALWIAIAAVSVLALVPVVHAAELRGGRRDQHPLAVPNFNLPAAELRVALDMTLAEHAFLLGEAMRAGLTMSADFDAVGGALEDNTTELVGMVGDVYGADAGEAFGDLWRSHVAYLIDYTRALAEDDDQARQIAEDQLHTYVQDFSAFLASANPNLPQAAVDELVSEHVRQLEAVAALDQGNYDEAYPALHRTYEHMFVIGDALSEAIAKQFPQRFRGSHIAFSPAGDLRVALNRLLGEHSTLAVTAMRSGLTDAADQSAAADALAANTDAMAAWVADVYGGDAAEAFSELWSTHTDAYIDYVDATVAGDQAGRDQALDELEAYQADFSRFLARANPHLSANGLRRLLEHHTDQLVDQAVAFSNGEYAEAYSISRATLRHAREMADALAVAIVTQFPNKYPDTAQAQDQPEGVRWPFLLLPMATLVALAVLGWWHKMLARRA